MNRKKSKSATSNTIALNKKARHDYILQDKIEAGVELQGWEVKSIRSGKVNLSDSYVTLHKGEAFLIGSTIQPLNQAQLKPAAVGWICHPSLLYLLRWASRIGATSA